jgi:hypothetical protein
MLCSMLETIVSIQPGAHPVNPCSTGSLLLSSEEPSLSFVALSFLYPAAEQWGTMLCSMLKTIVSIQPGAHPVSSCSTGSLLLSSEEPSLSFVSLSFPFPAAE